MKAISQKNKKLSSEIISTVETELKLFYFNAFKRRSKNLLTLELIKECYTDQINFFMDQILDLLSKILKDNLIPREIIKPGDRIRGYLMDVQSESRGPQLYISRKCSEFLIELIPWPAP